MDHGFFFKFLGVLRARRLRSMLMIVVLVVFSGGASLSAPTIGATGEQTQPFESGLVVPLEAFRGPPVQRAPSDGKESEAVLPGPKLEAVAGAMLKQRLQRAEAESASLDIFRRLAIAFHSRDYERVLTMIEGQFPNGADHVEILNIQGAALAELKRHDQAVAIFRQVLERDPTHFWARFNIAEIDMLEGRTASARAKFQAIKPAGEKENEILDMKIALTYLVEGKREPAVKIIEAMKFPSSSPARYVALAALAFHDGDRALAHQYLMESEKVFPGQLAGFYLRTLEDAGMSPTLLEAVSVPVSPNLPYIVDAPDSSAKRPVLPLDLRANDLTLGEDALPASDPTSPLAEP